MTEPFFYNIRELEFEAAGDGLPAGVRGMLEDWLPGGIGVLATLHNFKVQALSFDYILVTEAFVCFAIFTNDDSGCRLRSMKCFKTASFMALAHILAACPGEEGEEYPQVRLMLEDGSRIRLIFSEEAGQSKEFVGRLQQLAHSTFFRR